MTMGPKSALNPRGRPRNSANPRTRKADAAISRTVWQLLMWGFSLRPVRGVAEVVGQLARSELQRTCPAGKDLGPDQIEKIFEAWTNDDQRIEGIFSRGRPWNRINVQSLRVHAPRDLGLREVAKALIRNGGEWPDQTRDDADGNWVSHGDHWLTKKAHAEYLRNRLRWADSPYKTG